MRYSIEDTTLTGIADALRSKLGETRLEDGGIVTKISKTINATGFDSFEGDHQGLGETYDTVTIPGAESIHVKMAYQTFSQPNIYIQVAAGSHTADTFPIVTSVKYGGQELKTVELTFENTDSVTFRFNNVTGSNFGNFLGYYAEITGQSKVEVPNTYDPLDMADAIDSIEAGYVPTDEELMFEAISQYKFAFNSWNWVIENYGDRITTKNLTNLMYTFKDCDELTEIPFALNCKADTKNSVTNIFYGCKKLKSVPKINNLKVDAIDSIFHYCSNLREIPDDIDANWDWSDMDSLTSAYSGNRANTFHSCYSLRKFPMSFLNHGNPAANHSYSIYNSCFYFCYALDEIIGLPFPHKNATWTSNAFNNTFTSCYRVKNIIFALQEDGTPYSVNWKNQAISLINSGKGVGVANVGFDILNYNSGITEDKQVTDDASYQALKNDPDWWTRMNEYSRYNHDSAVNTINTLPDVTQGSGNTIKFKGDAGSLTDGGAISTLTEEEIAVAAAKGWTVTLA